MATSDPIHRRCCVTALVVMGAPLVIDDRFVLKVLTFVGINVMIVIGLSILFGYAGQISLGPCGVPRHRCVHVGVRDRRARMAVARRSDRWARPWRALGASCWRFRVCASRDTISRWRRLASARSCSSSSSRRSRSPAVWTASGAFPGPRSSVSSSTPHSSTTGSCGALRWRCSCSCTTS